jgi:hypothetical protein
LGIKEMDLVDKDVKEIIPDFIAVYHDEIMSKFLRRGNYFSFG